MWQSVLLLYIGGSRRNVKLTEEQRLIVDIVVLIVILALIIWGGIVLYRYNYIKRLIERKLKWSEKNDPFWNYDSLVEIAKTNYIKAQLFLNSTSYESLPFLTPYAKARLRLIKKKIKSEKDIEFFDSFIVWFKDKQDDRYDQVCVHLDLKNKNTNSRHKEMIVMQRAGDSSMFIMDVIKHPTMYMITHSRSIIEKY